jgi:hypothetical protein
MYVTGREFTLTTFNGSNRSLLFSINSFIDTSLNLSDYQPMNLDNSFSIGDIMQQQSMTAMDVGSNNNLSASANNSTMSHAAEQSSRHLLIAALPKTTAAYVFIRNVLAFFWFAPIRS